jgi:hypothetical protein
MSPELKTLDRPDRGDFKPLAEVDFAVNLLKARGIAFVREQDDLDDYEIAYLSIETGVDFVVMRYSNWPADKCALLVSGEHYDGDDTVALVRKVAEALDIPLAAFHWRSDRGEMSSAA